MGTVTRRPPVVRLVIGAALALVATAAGTSPVLGATTFGTPTIESTFGTGITFRQPVTLDGPPSRVELLLTEPGTISTQVVEVTPPTTGGSVVLSNTLSTAGSGHMLPNTPITARWRVTPSGGAEALLGPDASTTYADDRFAWQTVSGPLVHVHWYQGSQAFGERALKIGEDAIAKTSKLLGVTEKQPIDFFVYADQQAFYDALGPGTRENVGGQANAEIRTLFALIQPNAIDAPWVSIVIPHELVHLVFNTAVANPYHFPPRWLNEGLAVYLSQGYDASDRASVRDAAGNGGLLPLTGLGGQFPTSLQGFSLAYAESVSAVDYLIRTHGQDALVRLIRSYADGRTDDEAFTSAIGLDVAGFDAAWRGDVGASTPERFGPKPAAPGPVPPGWDAAAVGANAAPAAASPAVPTPTMGTAAAQPANSSAGVPVNVIVLAAAFVIVAALIVVAYLVRRPTDGAAS